MPDNPAYDALSRVVNRAIANGSPVFANMPECDVCRDRTGTHELYCSEGAGREDVIGLVREITGDTGADVSATGGGGRAIIASLTDRPITPYGFPEVWVTGLGGMDVAPSRDDDSDGWLVGVSPNASGELQDSDTVYTESRDRTLAGLRDALTRALSD